MKHHHITSHFLRVWFETSVKDASFSRKYHDFPTQILCDYRNGEQGTRRQHNTLHDRCHSTCQREESGFFAATLCALGVVGDGDRVQRCKIQAQQSWALGGGKNVTCRGDRSPRVWFLVGYYLLRAACKFPEAQFTHKIHTPHCPSTNPGPVMNMSFCADKKILTFSFVFSLLAYSLFGLWRDSYPFPIHCPQPARCGFPCFRPSLSRRNISRTKGMI
jgi:hypothetical protein